MYDALNSIPREEEMNERKEMEMEGKAAFSAHHWEFRNRASSL